MKVFIKEFVYLTFDTWFKCREQEAKADMQGDFLFVHRQLAGNARTLEAQYVTVPCIVEIELFLELGGHMFGSGAGFGVRLAVFAANADINHCDSPVRSARFGAERTKSRVAAWINVATLDELEAVIGPGVGHAEVVDVIDRTATVADFGQQADHVEA